MSFFFIPLCFVLTVSFPSGARSDKEHFHGEERGDGSLAADRVRRPRSMTTGVCSKTVARGRKIRANPPYSASPCVCLPSRPFCPRSDESKWRHRTLTTLTHFPVAAPARLLREVTASARAGDALASVTCNPDELLARTRHFYDDPSGPLYPRFVCKTVLSDGFLSRVAAIFFSFPSI